MANSQSQRKAAVLWSGGKDCCLALSRCLAEEINVKLLITLVPDKSKEFHAHPQKLIIKQAASARIDHRFIVVKAPFKEGYQEAFRNLKREGISLIVTGDISEVHGNSNWVSDCARGIIDVYLPLWHQDRNLLINELFQREIKAYLSLVYKNKLPKAFTGRVYDEEVRKELLNRHKDTGFDICGENGEFHTMVFDAPFFTNPLPLPRKIMEEESYWRIDPENSEVEDENDKVSGCIIL